MSYYVISYYTMLYHHIIVLCPYFYSSDYGDSAEGGAVGGGCSGRGLVFIVKQPII